MRTGLVIPSLGGPHLPACLSSVAALDPPPRKVVLVLSGSAPPPTAAGKFELLRSGKRLGFAAAVNLGLESLADDTGAVAVLNDDALPEPGWLGTLDRVLERRPKLAAVQGTITTDDGSLIDGRGITFDEFGLPVQVDHGQVFSADDGERPVTAVSGTACVFRMQALDQITLNNGAIFDQAFDCYHEDLDVGLRLLRMGWQAAWVGGAPVRHLGSASGMVFPWHHPWWLLANRWRALAGNLTFGTVVCEMPRLFRGEVRAVRTLARSNRRALPTAAAVMLSLPVLLIGGRLRSTPGARLQGIPEIPS